MGNRSRPTMYLGSVLYMVGLLPTVVFLFGWVASLRPGKLEGERLARYTGAMLILFTGLMFLPAMSTTHGA